MNTYDLCGKNTIVTGAASGIGLAIAKLFAKSGANVALWDVDNDANEKAAEELKAFGTKTLVINADTSDESAVKEAIEMVMEEFGGLDIAVNNAGIGGELAFSGDYKTSEWDRVLGINLSGVFLCQKYEIQAMKKDGGGSIINMASILGSVGFAGAPAYVAAKHGVVGLTKSAALEHASDKIRVNAIGPAFIHTPLVDNSMDKATLELLYSKHAMGRMGTPEEVATLTAWIASDDASFCTGAYYPVDGGYLAQ